MDYIRLKNDITSWLYKKITDAGCAGAVVGVSGGLDSAVVIRLAQEAFPDSVFGVILPCGNSKEDEIYARELCDKFSIPYTTINYEPLFESFCTLTGNDRVVADLSTVSEKTHKLALANTKSRMRMITLYYYAQTRNALVLGTGNRTEAELGYFTKHGDGGVDLLPIVDLFKSEVKELARVLGVTDAIVDRVPTGGLWLGQTDEGEIGLSYDEMEFGLRKIYDLPENKLLTVDKSSDTILKRLQQLMKISAHKRAMPPRFTVAR